MAEDWGIALSGGGVPGIAAHLGFLQVLEAEVGVPVLHRSGQGVALTPQGQELLPLAQEIDRLVQSARGVVIGCRPEA